VVLKYSGAAFAAAPEVVPTRQQGNAYMKRISITDNVLVPNPDLEGQMKTLFVGTVADVDDNTAGLVVASGRGAYVRKDEDGKYEKQPVDTTPADPVPPVAEKAEKQAK
jgi:hypothetical protein